MRMNEVTVFLIGNITGINLIIPGKTASVQHAATSVNIRGQTALAPTAD